MTLTVFLQHGKLVIYNYIPTLSFSILSFVSLSTLSALSTLSQYQYQYQYHQG